MFAAYPVLLLLILYVLSYLFPEVFNENNLLNYDALHYREIAEDGYVGFEVAFFPLFPKIWGVLGFGVLEVCLFNFLIFYISFYYLISNLSVPAKWLPYLFAIPGFVFFLTPYSEAFFFLGGSILLIGIKKDKRIAICAGLMLCGLSRPAFTVFIPALIFLELLTDGETRRKVNNVLIYVGTLIIAMFVVAYWQYLDTGEWFKFFEAQSKWDNELRMPTLPLRSWSDQLIIRFDGLALLVGLICAGVLTKELISLIWKKTKTTIPSEVIFSMLYLAGISVAVLLFRGGSLFSLNRFVFSTAFIVVVLNYYLKKEIYFGLKRSILIFLLLNVYWLLFGSFVHISFFLKFFLLSVFCWIFLQINDQNKQLASFAYWFCLIVMFEFQIYLIIRYLDGQWVA